MFLLSTLPKKISFRIPSEELKHYICNGLCCLLNVLEYLVRNWNIDRSCRNCNKHSKVLEYLVRNWNLIRAFIFPFANCFRIPSEELKHGVKPRGDISNRSFRIPSEELKPIIASASGILSIKVLEYLVRNWNQSRTNAWYPSPFLF